VSEDLIDWLRAQLDDDERKARAATPGPWWDSKILAAPGHHTIRGGPSNWRGFDGSLGGDTRPIARIEPAPDVEGNFVTNHDADAEHIARHDPARVLREVEARRRLIDQYEAMRAGAEASAGTILAGAAKVRLGAYEMAVKIMALPYSDHPGFREEWRS
jgi:hypothetical protein